MIKNYLNYIGSKDRYYPIIRKFLEKSIEGVEKPRLIDMFCGSGVVGFNSLDLFDEVLLTDGCLELISIHRWIRETPLDKLLEEIHRTIDIFKLSKENKDGFLTLRDVYNQSAEIKDYRDRHVNPNYLYNLICHSFNYSLHLTKTRKFSVPFGKNRSYFSESLEKKLIAYKKHIESFDARKTIYQHFTLEDYDMDIDIRRGTNKYELYGDDYPSIFITKDDVLFVDPPYSASISKHPYRIGDLKWTADEDKTLFDILDFYNDVGTKIVMTNVFENNGMVNEPLIEWSKQYNVIHVSDIQYKNCNYQRKNKGLTDEVIITNF